MTLLVGQAFFGFAISSCVGLIFVSLILCKYRDYLMGAYYGNNDSRAAAESTTSKKPTGTSTNEFSCQETSTVGTTSPQSSPERKRTAGDIEEGSNNQNDYQDESEDDDDDATAAERSIAAIRSMSEWAPSWDEDEWAAAMGNADGILGIQEIDIGDPRVEACFFHENHEGGEEPVQKSFSEGDQVVSDSLAKESVDQNAVNAGSSGMRDWLGRWMCADVKL